VFELRRADVDRLARAYLQLRHQLLHYHRLRAVGGAGNSPLDVDITDILLVGRFLDHDPVLAAAGVVVPSAQYRRALDDWKDGGDPEYFKREQMNRPPLDSRKRLMGVITFLRETLVVGKAFKAGKASIVIMKQLNAAGLCMPDGGSFTDATITDWHERVAHHGQRGELEWDTFEALRQALKLRQPKHVGWNRERLLQWLRDEFIPQLVSLGYFNCIEKSAQ
jgi:hypothetical protein